METTVDNSAPAGARIGEGLTFEKVWASIQESRLEWEKELKDSRREWEKRQEELDWKLGRLGNRLGELIELFAASNLMEKFGDFGYDFDQIARNIYIKDENKQHLAQIDLLLENGEYAAVVEVKSLVSVADVKEHEERMAIIRERADKRGDRRKYIAAMAGALYDNAAKAKALESGMYVVEQTGYSVRIQAPSELTLW